MKPVIRFHTQGVTGGLAIRTQVRAYRWCMTELQDLLDQAPEACTLPTVERPLRISEFADLFATATADVVRTSATQATVTLPLDALELARDLAARETECCSFFTFTTVPNGDHTSMTIEVPELYAEVLTSMTNLSEGKER